MVHNKFPAWKNALIIITLLLGGFFALPNLFGSKPALQIIGRRNVTIDASVVHDVNEILKNNKIAFVSLRKEDKDILIKFNQEANQQQAKKLLKKNIGQRFVVADHLAPARPDWMEIFGANPMKLGLDLSGGVHLLIQVDTDSAIKARNESAATELRALLREQKIHYALVEANKKQGLVATFRNSEDAKRARELVRQMHDYNWNMTGMGTMQVMRGEFSESAIRDIKRYTIEQTLTILRSRVNELGVSEPLVQQEGESRVVVELPGVQNSAQAEDIIGRTATVKFYLVDEKVTPDMLAHGRVPPNNVVFKDAKGRPYALNRRPVLTGDAIVGAYADFGDQGAEVSLRVGGNLNRFTKITGQNIGRRMASVYTETRFDTEMVDGKSVRKKRVIQEVINAATIQAALGARFRITGLSDMGEARNLALLLRAGALSAPIYIVESRTIGPTLGQQNITMGMQAMLAGLGLVLVFMAIYYGIFGIIADIALVTNLVLLTAILSLFHAVLTLPGIAGIVLTLGMAVDANVLIFERIREEIRNKASIQAAIHAGYEKAFVTIVDANVTTFIAALVLFTIGTGPIKGFAVVLSIGLLTSIFTAVTVSRALINAIYGNRPLKRLPIGI